jgi:hypothetical protein
MGPPIAISGLLSQLASVLRDDMTAVSPLRSLLSVRVGKVPLEVCFVNYSSSELLSDGIYISLLKDYYYIVLLIRAFNSSRN